MHQFIDDCIDLIDFANADPTTNEWAKLRADMGHPAPFNLKFLAIGNEQWEQPYYDRLAIIAPEVRKAHPEIKLIGTSGPNAEDDFFKHGWPAMRELKADLVDEHFYRPYDWFLSQGARYDNYDRKGPRVFAGEYACHAKGRKLNHFYASLLEAAFMTGLERNADVVHMATYAPLFAHVEGWQWRPDLIWYDNLNSFRTASWHVQQLYSAYKGQNVLKTTMDGASVSGAEGQEGLFASSVIDGGKVYVKVVNTTDGPRTVTLNFTGLKKSGNITPAERVRFTTDRLYEDNALDAPDRIAPVCGPFSAAVRTAAEAALAAGAKPTRAQLRSTDRSVEVTLAPYCFDIYIFDLQ